MSRELKKPDQNKAKQAMRKKIIAMLITWKPYRFGIWDDQRSTHKPNMDMIYEWINTYGHMKPKWLNKYTYEELVKLVSQIKQITNVHEN